MATKSICLYFQVHQPTRLRLYRFFDIGKDSHYYDDFANRTILRRVAQKCYLPMNQLMLETNPIPAKAACAAMGYGENRVRLPLVTMEEGTRQKMLGMMRELGLEVQA